MLTYDPDSDRLLGATYPVPGLVFRTRLARLLATHWTPREALSYLLMEQAWALGMAGVESRLAVADVLAAAETLLRAGHQP